MLIMRVSKKLFEVCDMMEICQKNLGTTTRLYKLKR